MIEKHPIPFVLNAGRLIDRCGEVLLRSRQIHICDTREHRSLLDAAIYGFLETLEDTIQNSPPPREEHFEMAKNKIIKQVLN